MHTDLSYLYLCNLGIDKVQVGTYGKYKSIHNTQLKVCNSGPVARKHGNLRSLLTAGNMTLGSTTGRQRHRVGKGEHREKGG